MYHLKEDIGSSKECPIFCIKALSILEKDNRNEYKLEKMALPVGAGVAEHGQTHNKQERG